MTSRENLQLDPFYLIVDSAAWIERLVVVGVKLVQLRIKDMPEPGLRAEVRAAKAICAREGCQLVVNDHWRLAIEEGCDFVHLGQEDLLAADLAAIRAAGLRLGVSTHDDGELDAALAVAPDYVALGPIWPTVLKAMRFAAQTPGKLALWRRRIGPLPLVAIGGITVERLPEVFAVGADSAAVVTDITRHPDPEARCRAWIAATKKHRRPNPLPAFDDASNHPPRASIQRAEGTRET